MRKKWLRVCLPLAMMLMLSGCLFRPPDELYRRPEKSAGYEKLVSAIQSVRSQLMSEFGMSCEDAVIVSGDNTATIQLQDLDGDGERESAVAFLRIPGAEKSLRIYIFRPVGGTYRVCGVIEGAGTAIYSVDYVNLNGIGAKELVVNWQSSSGVYQLGAYTLDELAPPMTGNDADLLATELLLTASSGSNGTGGYRLVDLDQDSRMEIAVVRMGSGDLGSQVELYGWLDGAFVSLSRVALSDGVVSLNRIRSNCLDGEYYPPALYVTCTQADGSKTVDVLAYQNGALCNLSLDETGVSRNRLAENTDVSISDVNNDCVLEIPEITPLPVWGGANSSAFGLVDWGQYTEKGNYRHVMTTYHNIADSWYLEVPEKWKDKITIYRNDSLSGQREVVFALWRGPSQEPVPFLSIYKLTGSNRASRAEMTGRFILREEEEVIYSARLYDCNWDCGLDQVKLMEGFQTIQPSWYSE